MEETADAFFRAVQLRGTPIRVFMRQRKPTERRQASVITSGRRQRGTTKRAGSGEHSRRQRGARARSGADYGLRDLPRGALLGVIQFYPIRSLHLSLVNTL